MKTDTVHCISSQLNVNKHTEPVWRQPKKQTRNESLEIQSVYKTHFASCAMHCIIPKISGSCGFGIRLVTSEKTKSTETGNKL